MAHEWTETQEKFPTRLGEEMIERAEKKYPDITKTDEIASGGTFVTLQDAVKLQSMTKDETGSTVTMSVEVRGETVQQNVRFIPSWPKSLIRVHPYNDHGAPFPDIPVPQSTNMNRDCRLLWLLFGMTACISVVWDGFVAGIESDEQWTGYALSYVTQRCYPACKTRTRNNPFKLGSQKRQGMGNKEIELMQRMGMYRVKIRSNKRAIIVCKSLTLLS